MRSAIISVVFLVWQSLGNIGNVFKVNISGIWKKNTKVQSARGWNSRSDYLCTTQKMSGFCVFVTPGEGHSGKMPVFLQNTLSRCYRFV